MIITKCQEVWGIGGTDAEAAFYADISPASISRYLDAHPDVKEYRNKLKEKPILKARRTVVSKLGESYQNAMDYLKRKKRLEFGDNVDLTTAGEKLPITGMKIINENGNRISDKESKAAESG